MATNDHMLNDLNFDHAIEQFSEPEKFLARQIRMLHLEMPTVNQRLSSIEEKCDSRTKACSLFIASQQGSASIPQTPKIGKREIAIGGGTLSGATILYLIAKAICAHYGITI